MSASIDFNDAPGLIAPAEMPTPEPSLTQQVASHRQWRFWWRESLEDSPSWLVSLILHLVAFLIVTSVAVPWSPAGKAGSGTISLTMGFADRTQESQGPQVTIEPTETVQNADPRDAADVPGREPLSEDRAASAEPSASVPTSARDSAASAAPSPTRQQSSPETIRSAVADVQSFRASPYAALLNRRRPTLGTSTAVVQAMRPITDPSSDPQQRALDQVVDDFIAYDIGQLRGAAGMAARQRFAALGPEALPALVRGLNKAAGIHASCPVGVIAGKLISTLQNANDPSLREFAINNIGVGVPEDAPHFHRLKALRKNWLGGPAMPPNVALIVDRLESRQEGELMELMLALSDAPSDTVIAALRSGDEYLGAAAVLAIIQGPQRWDAPQRAQLRAAVMHFQTLIANAQIKSLAADAQRVLSR